MTGVFEMEKKKRWGWLIEGIIIAAVFAGIKMTFIGCLMMANSHLG